MGENALDAIMGEEEFPEIEDPDGPGVEAESCQKCGSDDVEWSRDQTIWRCNDCGHYQ